MKAKNRNKYQYRLKIGKNLGFFKGEEVSISLIVLSGGNSTRFKYPVKKQWLRVGNKPLWLFVAEELNSLYQFKRVVVVASPDEVNLYRYLSPFPVVAGGRERQESLKNGLAVVETDWVMVTDVARPQIDHRVVEELITVAQNGNYDTIAPYLPAVDTVVYQNRTIDRREVKLIQTPQLSRTEILKKAVSRATLFTDDRGAVEGIGGRVGYILGSPKLRKLTYFSDLAYCQLPPPVEHCFTGIGYDSHRFVSGNSLKLGGVSFSAPFKFQAHSDGDVVVHGVIDALLGATTGGDIGELFPDTDPIYAGINSLQLLEQVVKLITKIGFEPIHIDLTYIGELPKLKKRKWEIVQTLSTYLNCSVNVKGTTNEKMGFIGRKEGAGVVAVATVKYKNWYRDLQKGLVCE